MDIKWALFPWTRCRAVLEPNKWSAYHGRCELPRKHEGDHAFERFFYVVYFSTRLEGRVPNFEKLDIYNYSANYPDRYEVY